jgi:hypothetical protein
MPSQCSPAVITDGSSGTALAGAKLFVEEGAHVSSRAVVVKHAGAQQIFEHAYYW